MWDTLFFIISLLFIYFIHVCQIGYLIFKVNKISNMTNKIPNILYQISYIVIKISDKLIQISFLTT